MAKERLGSNAQFSSAGTLSVTDKCAYAYSELSTLADTNEHVLMEFQTGKYILKGKVKNKKICFLGVTFKANTDDMRDSSSLSMIPSLIKKGAKINYFDPTGEKVDFKKFKNVNFSKNINSAIKNSDLIIIHTEWNDFKSINFKKEVQNKKFIIFDMRNIYSPIKMKKLKIKYFGLGC